MTEMTSDYETNSEWETISLTPSLKRRVRECASEHGWPIGQTIRYFLEVGLAVEVVPKPGSPRRRLARPRPTLPRPGAWHGPTSK